MSKRAREYLIENINDLRIPYSWADFVWVMTNHFGFNLANKRGAERSFIHPESGIIFTAHEPHKRGMPIWVESRRRAIRALLQLESLKKER